MKRNCTSILACAAAALAVLGVSQTASAFGGHAMAHGGERIVSSEVVSDEAVGEPYEVAYGATGGGVQNREYGQPDLFYNYYTQGAANSANAQMYASPVPVPPNVGQTFYTYQPFYPHEMLYWHQDKFHNYYDNGRGHNRTRATYYSPPVRQAASNFYWNFLRIPR